MGLLRKAIKKVKSVAKTVSGARAVVGIKNKGIGAITGGVRDLLGGAADTAATATATATAIAADKAAADKAAADKVAAAKAAADKVVADQAAANTNLKQSLGLGKPASPITDTAGQQADNSVATGLSAIENKRRADTLAAGASATPVTALGVTDTPEEALRKRKLGLIAQKPSTTGLG